MTQRVVEKSSPEQQWGSLRGQFTYLGNVPARPVTQLKNGIAVIDESMIVDEATRGVANVVVYLLAEPSQRPLEVHPQLRSRVDVPVTLKFQADRVIPHVALLQTHQRIYFENVESADDVINLDSPVNPVSISLRSGETSSHTFVREERVPLRYGSVIHSWLGGIVVVRDTPYQAITDQQGVFVIQNLPRGRWAFQFWHERLGWMSHLRIDGQEQQLPRGVFHVDIEQPTRDLGRLEIVPPI